MQHIDITERQVQSIADSLNELLRRLRLERNRLNVRISEIEEDLAAIGHAPDFSSVIEKSSQRSQWHENKKRLKLFLNEHASQDFTIPDLTARLSMARSSLMVTLKRLEKIGFVKHTEDGFWQRKKVDS